MHLKQCEGDKPTLTHLKKLMHFVRLKNLETLEKAICYACKEEIFHFENYANSSNEPFTPPQIEQTGNNDYIDD